MGATETVDLFFELINDDDRDRAVNLFAEHAVMGISVPGSDERTNLRGRDKVGGWFVRAGDGFRMYANDGRSMGASYIADVTVMRPGAPNMRVEANFRVENGEIVSLFLQPMSRRRSARRSRPEAARIPYLPPGGAYDSQPGEKWAAGEIPATSWPLSRWRAGPPS
jgi:hypothetical protein